MMGYQSFSAYRALVLLLLLLLVLLLLGGLYIVKNEQILLWCLSYEPHLAAWLLYIQPAQGEPALPTQTSHRFLLSWHLVHGWRWGPDTCSRAAFRLRLAPAAPIGRLKSPLLELPSLY